MSGLPQGWAEVPFGELNGFRARSIDPANFPDEEFELYSVPVFPTGKPEIARGKDIGSTKQLVSPGDVLVCKINPRINRVWMVSQPSKLRQIASSEWIVIRADGIYACYLRAFFSSPEFREELCTDLTGVGGSLTRAQPKRVATYAVPLAPLPEQTRIADKLDALLARVDAARERLARVPALLKRFRQSVLAAATSGALTEDWRGGSETIGCAKQELAEFLGSRKHTERKPPVEPDLSNWDKEVPKGWALCSVNQYAACLDRLRVPIKREDRKNVQGLYPYYGANGEVGRIDEYIFDDELVLVTEDETFYGREKPIAYRSSGKCWVNNHAHVLKAAGISESDFLCYSLMYYDVIPWLTGTTGRAKLTQEALNSLPIIVPPKVETVEIIRRVEALFALADKVQTQYETARARVDKLSPALLAKAFRGELVPQDPNDEPASALLERLRAAKASEPAAVRRGRKPATAAAKTRKAR